MHTIIENHCYKVTEEDIAALKQAKSLAFRHQPHDVFDGHTGGLIDCRIPQVENGKTTYTDYPIVVNTKINDYDTATPQEVWERWGGTEYADAIFRLDQPIEDGIMRTIVAMLLDGDIIQLIWHRNRTTQEAEKHGLATDELELNIFRSENQQFLFLIKSKTTPRHSPSRLVRRGSSGAWPEERFASRAWHI
jgi:hypothetical protein